MTTQQWPDPTTPTPCEAAALPVVAHSTSEGFYGNRDEIPSRLLPPEHHVDPLVRLSDAQAIIDRQAAELVDMRTRWNVAEEEFAVHKAAALPTIEAIMELVDDYATAVRHDHDDYKDVRESLRAALARALPVGEERDAARLDWIDRSRLTLAVNWNQVRPTSFEFAGFSIEGFSGVYPTCRLAIDSAMAPKGETNE